MTAAKATNGQPASTQEAVYFDGFERVARATGIKTTVIRHEGADGVAVELDRNDCQFTHLDCPLLQVRSSLLERAGYVQGASRVCQNAHAIPGFPRRPNLYARR